MGNGVSIKYMKKSEHDRYAHGINRRVYVYEVESEYTLGRVEHIHGLLRCDSLTEAKELIVDMYGADINIVDIREVETINNGKSVEICRYYKEG